jgi:threonine/homoserine/homoserine lactone efflux protein
LVPFLLAVALIELTPGPNMAYLSLVSVREGRTAGLLTVLGITLGLAAYMLASVAGLAEVAAAQPWAYHALRWAGVAYLAWLAVDTWRDAPGKPEAAGGRPPAGRLVLRGLVTNLLNPKAAIFYVSLLPSFTRPEQGGVAAQSLTLGSIHLAASVAIHCAIVATAGLAHPLLLGRAGSRLLRGVFAASLLGVAAWVAWTTHPG